MPDFPTQVVGGDCLVGLNTHGLETLLGQNRMAANATGSAAAWTTANTAIYIPVTIDAPFLAQVIAVDVTTQSGNLDVGIYSEQGTRLISSGSTAVAAAGVQTLNITDTWLAAGTYFIAMNCDNTTAAFIASNAGGSDSGGRSCGILQQAVGAVTLPNPAVFAVYTARVAPLILVAGVATV